MPKVCVNENKILFQYEKEEWELMIKQAKKIIEQYDPTISKSEYLKMADFCLNRVN
jgi:hypothetical protein